MVRHGDFKYTAYSDDGPDELYNVHDDPTEMRAKMKAWHEPA